MDYNSEITKDFEKRSSDYDMGEARELFEKIKIKVCCWTPIEFLNAFGVLYTFGIIFCLLSANAWFTCPIMYGQDKCDQPILVGYFILAEIVLNFLCFHYYGRTRNRIKNLMPGTLRYDGPASENTKYCTTCNEIAPRRAHHCPLCGYCVLRKDHHCYLTGGCVGFGNQRYFIVFLFWGCFGSLYATTYTFAYLNKFFKPFLPLGWIDYIGPVAFQKWIFWQHCDLLTLCLTFLFSFGVASSLGAAGFCLSQFYLIAKGQTLYDIGKPGVSRQGFFADAHPDNPFGKTLNDRIKAVFGPWWLLNFIIPMPCLPNKIDPEYLQLLYGCLLKEL